MTWSLTGDYENQKRFVRTMLLVLLAIFVLLLMVYQSLAEAAHVMLAVPFALSGGVFLQKLLEYPFNGTVWVGCIALFVFSEDIKFKCAYFNPMCFPRFFVCRPCPAGPLFLCLTLLPLLGIAPRLAAEQFGDFTYSEDGTSVTITKYTGTGGEVTIPSEIDGKPVKFIGKDAFFYQQTITRLELPGNLATIGSYAFAACDGLTSLVIPQSVSWIDGGAFTHCFNLTSITFKGNAPGVPAQSYVFTGAENRLVMYYYEGATGFTSPKWQNYPVVQLSLPVPVILSMAKLPGKFSVTISGVVGKTYQLQRNTGPGLAGAWTPVFTTEPLTGPEAELTDTAALTDSAFYRVAENSP